MDIVKFHGLTMAEATTDDVLATRWRAPDSDSNIDVVRLVDPDPDAWHDLRSRDFSLKPAWVTWTSPVYDDLDSHLASLSSGERRNIRLGLRMAATENIAIEVVDPLTGWALDEFLSIYAQQIAEMTNGVAFAVDQREQILERAADYLLVRATLAGELVGGCVCWKRDDIRTLQVRFASTEPGSRQKRLTRAVYMTVFAAARELGYTHVSLGSDPTLFGHIAMPGLYMFKSRMGFTPVPERYLDQSGEPDEAYLVTRLDNLSDPSLMLAYDLPSSRQPFDTANLRLRAAVLSVDARVDARPFTAPFLKGVDRVVFE